MSLLSHVGGVKGQEILLPQSQTSDVYDWKYGLQTDRVSEMKIDERVYKFANLFYFFEVTVAHGVNVGINVSPQREGSSIEREVVTLPVTVAEKCTKPWWEVIGRYLIS